MATISPSSNVSTGRLSQARAIRGNCDVKKLPRRDQSVTPVLSRTSQAAVAVKLDFVEPVLALGDVLNGEGMHWLNKLYGAGLGWLHRRQSEGTNKKLLTNHFWRDSNLPAASLCL